MRLSRVFGILSLLMFIFAILSLVLPAYSILSGVRVSSNQTSGTEFPTSLTVTNSGFLPVNGISLMVTMSAPDGTTLSTISVGPVDVPAGATVLLSIAQSGALNASTGLSYVTIHATASVNLGGLIPVSVSTDLKVIPSNNPNPGGSS
jgi:hypothetical protein